MIFYSPMLMRNKPRVVSLMADQPKSSKSLFRYLSSKITPFDSDFSLISPTSILEAANTSSIFFSSSSKHSTKHTSYIEPTIPNPQRFHPPNASGLADLVQDSKKHVNKMVLFGSKLRVHIPSADLGIKTGQLSPYLKTKVSTVSETEDYTRVISHGPNPTVTHIFDNSVYVEERECPLPQLHSSMLESKKANNFLSNCYTCNKNLVDHKQDIYIYRGEKGFCSSECRYQEMLLDQMES